MLKLFRYFKKIDWIQTIILIIVVVGQVQLALEVPKYMGNITGLVTNRESIAKAGDKLVSEILINGGYMLLFSAGSILCIIIVSLLSSQIGARFAMTLRARVFDKVESFSLEELSGLSTASLITRTTNDVTQVSSAVQMSMRFLIQAPVTIICAIIKIVNVNWQLSLAVAGAVGMLIILVIAIFLLVVPKLSILQKLIDKLNGVARENLTGLRVVRAYNAEGYQEQKFEKANEKLTKTHMFVDRAAGLLDPGITLIMNGLTLALYWLGAYLVNGASGFDAGLGQFQSVVEFMGYSMQIIMAFLFLTMMFVMIPRAMVSAKRINEVLDKPLKITDGPGVDFSLASDSFSSDGIPSGNISAKEFSSGGVQPEQFSSASVPTGLVQFKNVSFKYPDAEAYVLHDISFTAEKGQTVAFIGSTGSGKSTVVKLIPRFYDVTEGQVLVDGEDVRQYTQKQLRDKIGYVPQRGVLFSGTIRSNIVYGDIVADDDAMQKAAEIAQAADFIEERPEKYDSAISQGGKNVSGGQKQRLSIARAVVKNPEIYVFDDSFSALDYKTDKQLRAALKQHTSGATCLIVAQRIGTIMNADKIIVLDSGSIVGEGTHAELLKTCAVYREIAYSQLSKEELA